MALIRGGLDRRTVLFVGWFGPRGLASIVFGIIAVDALPSAEGKPLISLVMLTVLLSVLLHGVTARPLARRYGGQATNLDDDDDGNDDPAGGGRIRTRHLGEHHTAAAGE